MLITDTEGRNWWLPGYKNAHYDDIQEAILWLAGKDYPDDYPVLNVNPGSEKV